MMKNSIFLYLLTGIAFVFFSLTSQFNYQVKSLEPGPVQTFENNCARCHGPRGSFYGGGFGSANHGGLRNIVEEMMRGPAFLQPSKADVKAMTAYHRALNTGEPFICITGYDSSSNVLRGEVVLQDELFIRKPDGELRKVQVDSSGFWQTNLLSNSILMARNDSTSTKLNPQKNQWSHQKQK